MICTDCCHAIIRTIITSFEESYLYCELDGKLMTPLKECSRYAKNEIPGIPEEVFVAEINDFQCDVCGKAFKTKFSLTGHMRSHK